MSTLNMGLVSTIFSIARMGSKATLQEVRFKGYKGGPPQRDFPWAIGPDSSMRTLQRVDAGTYKSE